MVLATDFEHLFQNAAEREGLFPAHRPPTLLARGLIRLADALEKAAGGEASALRAARREIGVWINSYVAFQRDLAEYPEIAEVPVIAPVFIAAFGRTGSTLLHNLLALAPQARAPRLWELWSPSPPPRGTAGADRGRIDSARRRVEFLATTAPVVAKAHPMDAEAPDECHWMMRHSPLWVMLYDVPEYWQWLVSLSMDELRELSAHYRLQIQHLTLFQRGTWISKSFSHLHFLPVLYDVFPDARLVRLHRDPGAAIPSLCSLAQNYRAIFSKRVDPRAIGAGILDLFVDGMGRAMALDRARPEAPVVDLAYDALLADPVGAACGVLEALGYPRDAASERAMRAWLERAAERPAYRHDYTLEQFGLSRTVLLDRCSAYLNWAAARCGRPLL